MNADPEYLIENGVIIRHKRAVDPPIITVYGFAAQNLLGGFQVAAMVASGKPVLKVKPRPENKKAKKNCQKQKDPAGIAQGIRKSFRGCDHASLSMGRNDSY